MQDIEIARNAKLKNINEIAQKLGISEDYLEQYGKYKAKISLDYYDKIKNIASEARQKLKEVKPTSIGQAIRISGVNPADISIMMVYLKKEYYNDRKRISN